MFLSALYLTVIYSTDNKYMNFLLLRKMRKLWLMLLKDNGKEVNQRRREFIFNVGRGGERHVRGGQVVI